MIDGALFQDQVESRKVMAVPTVFLNGQPFGQGRMELGEIVAKLDAGGAERDVARLNAKAPYDVLVVGGGPCRRRGGRVRGAQGNSYGHRGRADRRPAVGYGG